MITRGTTANKWLTSEDRITTRSLAKVTGWFFYVEILLTVHKNECKQSQKKHSKSHKVFKIKLHTHHPHSVRMKVSHPSHGCSMHQLYHICYRLSISDFRQQDSQITCYSSSSSSSFRISIRVFFFSSPGLAVEIDSLARL